MPIIITLHVLSAVIWVGGMFFAHMALRPAVQDLDPPQRLQLWVRTFARFFPWVWGAVLTLPATGYWIIFSVSGGFSNVNASVHLMQTIGIVMIFIFLYVFFAPYQGLKRATDSGDFTLAGKQLGRIRKLITINLILGLLTVAIATSGPYWA